MTQTDQSTRFMDMAWHRDNSGIIHSGESIVLLCLLHAKGKSRKSKDAVDVRKMMRDHNLED